MHYAPTGRAALTDLSASVQRLRRSGAKTPSARPNYSLPVSSQKSDPKTRASPTRSARCCYTELTLLPPTHSQPEKIFTDRRLYTSPMLRSICMRSRRVALARSSARVHFFGLQSLLLKADEALKHAEEAGLA